MKTEKKSNVKQILVDVEKTREALVAAGYAHVEPYIGPGTQVNLMLQPAEVTEKGTEPPWVAVLKNLQLQAKTQIFAAYPSDRLLLIDVRPLEGKHV